MLGTGRERAKERERERKKEGKKEKKHIHFTMGEQESTAPEL